MKKTTESSAYSCNIHSLRWQNWTPNRHSLEWILKIWYPLTTVVFLRLYLATLWFALPQLVENEFLLLLFS